MAMLFLSTLLALSQPTTNSLAMHVSAPPRALVYVRDLDVAAGTKVDQWVCHADIVQPSLKDLLQNALPGHGAIVARRNLRPHLVSRGGEDL